MTALLLLLLTQTPTQPGAMNLNSGLPINKVTCSGATCTKTGQQLSITVSGSGGSGAPLDGGYLTLTAGSTGSTNEKVLTGGSNINITAGGVVSVTGTVPSATSATTATSASTATALASNPTDCASDRYATTIDTGGNLTCAQVTVAGISATGTPSGTTYLRGDGTWATVSGGGGAGNFVSDTITFAGRSDATKTVTAAWATGSSNILCTPLDEEGSVEGLQLTVTSRSAGSFVVRGYVLQGTHTGSLTLNCTGN